jgi:DNA modification methylase
MQAYYETPNLALYQGDCLKLLAALPEKSVHCVVTSPPYWGLRDYGLPPSVWDDPGDCRHVWGDARWRHSTSDSGSGLTKGGKPRRGVHFSVSTGAFCQRCAAWRGCLGLEPTPEMFVQHLVEVFRGVWRVLRDDGTCWVNLGDSYCNTDKWGGGKNGNSGKQTVAPDGSVPSWEADRQRRPHVPGLKPKDLVGIPWRVAFALQADGWYLRADCIWHKPNPMPESCQDRPTKAHEYLFLLTKKPRYFYDQEAVREPSVDPESLRGRRKRHTETIRAHDPGFDGHRTRLGLLRVEGQQYPTRNRRSVWTLATQPFSARALGITGIDHFATFPQRLVEPCLLAGTSAAGCCARCGAPLQRVVKRETVAKDKTSGRPWLTTTEGNVLGRDTTPHSGLSQAHTHAATTTGWRRTCRHDDAPVEPCTVLDPFAGAATTLLVAQRHGRRSIGLEASAAYCALATARLQQGVR